MVNLPFEDLRAVSQFERSKHSLKASCEPFGGAQARAWSNDDPIVPSALEGLITTSNEGGLNERVGEL